MSGILQAITAMKAVAGGGGSLAFDAASEATLQTGNGTLTWSHTCGGSDRVLIVGISSFAMTVTGVTYNSVAMTSIGTIATGSFRVTLFRLIAPATGANNIVASFSGPPGYSYGGAVSFTGAHQTTPVGTPATATGNSSAPSVSVSGATGDIVVDALTWETLSSSNTGTVGAGQTDRWNDSGTIDAIGGGGSTEAGAASVTMSWSLAASRNWAIIGVAVKPA